MKSVFMALWCLCFMLIAVIGCDQEMKMMKPAVQDVMDPKPEDKPDTTMVVPQPDAEIPDQTDEPDVTTDVSEVGPTIFNVGDIISTLPPTGLLRGTINSEGEWSLLLFADGRLIFMDNGAKFTYQGYTYACVGEGDCRIDDNVVSEGTIERTSADN